MNRSANVASQSRERTQRKSCEGSVGKKVVSPGLDFTDRANKMRAEKFPLDLAVIKSLVKQECWFNTSRVPG